MNLEHTGLRRTWGLDSYAFSKGILSPYTFSHKASTFVDPADSSLLPITENQAELVGASRARTAALLSMNEQELADMFTQMGQEADAEETVLASQLAAEAFLDDAW